MEQHPIKKLFRGVKIFVLFLKIDSSEHRGIQLFSLADSKIKLKLHETAIKLILFQGSCTTMKGLQ